MPTQKELREKFIKAGVNFIDADTVYLSDDTQIGTGATIEPFVIIGREVKIASGAIIKGFTHLEQCIIDHGTSVGPFARIRDGSHLKANVRVGNFVELKNTTLESGVKSGHLTYLGDATVGANTNIGAGTITCNYDGHHKFKTVIGNNCFIGSNTLIVAPAVIGDGALTATGTVITRDIASNAIAISRAELKERPKAAIRYHKKREKK